MKVFWTAVWGLIFAGCSLHPILDEKDYTKYCSEPGACEAYLQARMLQYQSIGGVVVGVKSPPPPTPREIDQ